MRQTWPECPTSPAPAVTTPHLGAHVSSKPLPAFSVLTATVLPKLGFLLLVQVLPERNRGEESNFQSSGTNTATAGDRGVGGTSKYCPAPPHTPFPAPAHPTLRRPPQGNGVVSISKTRHSRRVANGSSIQTSRLQSPCSIPSVLPPVTWEHRPGSHDPLRAWFSSSAAFPLIGEVSTEPQHIPEQLTCSAPAGHTALMWGVTVSYHEDPACSPL